MGTLVDLFPTTRKGASARAAFFGQAEQHISQIVQADKWPLSEPQSGTAGLYVPIWKFDLSDEMMQLLQNSARGLYDWHSPKLPEDLAVYRRDGSVLLGTVAHEHIGWMNLTNLEAADMRLSSIGLQEMGW